MVFFFKLLLPFISWNFYTKEGKNGTKRLIKTKHHMFRKQIYGSSKNLSPPLEVMELTFRRTAFQLHVSSWTSLQLHVAPCSSMQRHVAPCSSMQLYVSPCSSNQLDVAPSFSNMQFKVAHCSSDKASCSSLQLNAQCSI